MSIQQLSLETLRDLDMGKVMEAFNLHIARASRDCMDRPGDSKARSVTLQLALVPVLEPDGSCDQVKAQVHISSKVPTHRTKVYSLGLRRNGALVFNPDSPDDINQTTLLGDDD